MITRCTRVLVLVSSRGTRKYPLPDTAELRDRYTLDGIAWTVAAVLTSADVPLTPHVFSKVSP